MHSARLAYAHRAAALNSTWSSGKTFMSKHKLISDLEHFDLCKVQCSNEFDKEFIYGAIEEWQLDSF